MNITITTDKPDFSVKAESKLSSVTVVKDGRCFDISAKVFGCLTGKITIGMEQFYLLESAVAEMKKQMEVPA